MRALVPKACALAMLAHLALAFAGAALAQPSGAPVVKADSATVGTAAQSQAATTTPRPDPRPPGQDVQRAGPGEAAQTPPDSVYSAMFKALFTVLVLAVILESALAVIFNWRPFLQYFDGRGVRTLISLVFAWYIATLLKLDIVAQLHAATSGVAPYDLGGVGVLVTALVLSGGSSGVNNILRSLGFRDVRREEHVTPRPARNTAWLSVRVRRENAVGPVRVLIRRGAGEPELVGMIQPGSSPSTFLRWFLRDPTRFPMSGGWSVEAGETYAVLLEGEDADRNPLCRLWGPRAIARGAIIDLELSL